MNNKLVIGNDQNSNIIYLGNTFILSFSSIVKLNNVLIVSYIIKNMVSISQFTKDNALTAEFYVDYCFLKDKIGLV